jgi:hypothetical protein
MRKKHGGQIVEREFLRLGIGIRRTKKGGEQDTDKEGN